MKVFAGKRWAFGLVAIGLCCGFAGLSFSGSVEEKHAVVVRAKDMPGAVQIIGSCGQPLGSLITIRGKWVGPELRKDAGPFFEVFLVNGKKPEEAVEFAWGQMDVIFFRDDLGHGVMHKDLWDWHFDYSGTQSAPEPKAGETWEMLGVESGHFNHCYSKEAWKIIGIAPLQPATYARAFYTTFDYIALRKLQ